MGKYDPIENTPSQDRTAQASAQLQQFAELRQAVYDESIDARKVETGDLDEVDFKEKYGQSTHAWKLNNAAGYFEEQKKKAANTPGARITLPEENFFSSIYNGNPNMAYTRPNQTTAATIAGTESFNNELIESVLPMPILETGQAVKAYKKAKGIFGKSMGSKNVDNSVRAHDIRTNPDIEVQTIVPEGESFIFGQKIPVNINTGNTLQDEFIQETKEWYASPQFKKIMKEQNPDVDIDLYKQATLRNLENKLSVSSLHVSEGAVGTYYPKYRQDPNVTITPNASLKARVKHAIGNDDVSRGDLPGRAFVDKNAAATYHELGHLKTNSDELLPSSLTKEELEAEYIGPKNYKEDFTKPTEFEVRAQQVRKDLKKKGIADFHNEDITEDHLEQYLASAEDSPASLLLKDLGLLNESDLKKQLLSTDAESLFRSYSKKFIASKINTLLGGAAVVSVGGKSIYDATLDNMYE